MANPISITTGSSTVLTSACTNATSASIDQGVGAVSATATTTRSVSPATSKTYTLTCTDASGNSATDSVAVAVTDPAISGTCSVSPTTLSTGGQATWTANPSGGNGTYTYSWSGTDSLTGSTKSVQKTYSTIGTKTASVTITSGTAPQKTIICNNNVVVSDPTLSTTCSVSPTSITAGGSATWTANPVGGNGVYTYSWTGTDSLTGSTKSVTKTYNTAGTQTASVTVTSNGQSVGPQACSNNLTVNSVAQPDITVTAAPTGTTSFTQGTAETFNGTIQNIGAGAASNVPNVLQVLDSAGTTNLARFAASPATVNIAAAGSAAVTGTVPASTYPFNTVGTYKVRFCGNMNTSGVNVITETAGQYGNNCGPMQTVTVNSSGPTGSLSCTVSPASITTPPGNVTYTVTPSGGASGPYTWNDTQGGSYGTGSTANRTISGSGSYVMNVSGTNVITQPVSCPVVSGGCGSASGSLTASPDRVRSGNTTTLSWTASGVSTSCTLTGPGVNTTVPASSCNVITTPVTTPAITAQSVYTLTCDGTQVAQAIVNVIPGFQEF